MGHRPAVRVAALALAAAAGAVLAASPSTAANPVTSDPFPSSCVAFPADSYWHADVRRLPRNARSSDWMRHMSPGVDLHPDFGPAGGGDFPYGIPLTVVAGSHAKKSVAFDYADESDPGPYPLGDDTLVEGGSYAAGGDKHTVVVDRDTCRLYETWNTRRPTGTTWRAGSGATWDLAGYAQRPDGWTSADAAGLPILPGLLRWEEVESGVVDHAIRFTTDRTDRRHVWPARHDAGSVDSRAYPPMGARFRLKSSYVIRSGLSAETKVVLTAMKTYGLVLADNGSPWFFQGTADDRWSDTMIEQLKDVPASAFEAVDAEPLKISADSTRVRVRASAQVTGRVQVSSARSGNAALTVTGAGTPFGIVRVLDGSRVIGSAHLVGGRATVTFGRLRHGRHHLKVTYGGSSKHWPDSTRSKRITVTSALKTGYVS